MSGAPPSFESFAAGIAAIAGCEPETVSRESLLVGDLALDSLGFAELAVMLADRYGGEAFAAALEQIEWESLNVGSVFDNYAVRRTGQVR